MLLEAAFVVLVGGVFAFAANEISPRGLALARNYFPNGMNNAVRMTATAATNTAAIPPAQLLAAELKKNGLQLLDGNQTERLFHDPGFQRGAIIFIDARDEAHYRAGHVPGAYEFDPYHPEKYFPAVLPVCQAAEQIVVYCNGGDCDDSESAALLLRDVGIANRKLLIYGGGITEWTNNRLPVEIGAGKAESLRNTNR
jgi:rhodanese-related sulfurtransferase